MDVTDDVYFDFYTILKNVFLCTRGSMKIKDEKTKLRALEFYSAFDGGPNYRHSLC